MLIYVFVPNYPSLYKPYYDSQFAELIQRGHDVRIFSLGNIDPGVNEKVTEFGLDRRTSRYYPEELRGLWRFAPDLARAFARDPATRSSVARKIRRRTSTASDWVRHTARMLTLPVQAPDVCLVHSVRTMSLFPWLRDLYPGAPLALFYHGGGLLGATPEAVFGHADVVFTNTEYSVSEATSLGCPPEKLTLLPVGFDLEEYRPPTPRRYRPDGVLRLLSASRLGEEKGHVYALEAVSALVRSGFRDLRYTIIGDGRAEMRAMLERRVQELALDGFVNFVGSPPTRAVIAAMGAADVLLLPSFEYRGIVEMQAACVQEAAMMGALVVTTRTGGVPESTPPSLRPFMVECRDSAALAASIRRIHQLPDTEMAERAASAGEWVRERYDIRRLNSRMLAELHRRASRAPLPIQEPTPEMTPLLV